MTIIWSYNQTTGPEKWAELSHSFACAAEYQWQSPIALSEDLIEERKASEAPVFHYQKQRFTRDFFNRSIHFIPDEPKSFLVYGGTDYYLNDIHFHHPSEHHLEGHQHDLEIHFVHVSKQGDRLVAGVLVTEDENLTHETAIQRLLPVQETTLEIDVREALPALVAGYAFTGSLTTPPTEGPIQWFVFSETPHESTNYLKAIRALLPEENARPVQPLNGRKITYIQQD